MSNTLFATLFAVSSMSALLPAPPIGAVLPTDSKVPIAIIYEWSDYGGSESTAKARVTPQTARAWCLDFPTNSSTVEECTASVLESERNTAYVASANCDTGEMTSHHGEKLLFDGFISSHDMWNGYVAMLDMETGKRLDTSNAAGGVFRGSQWRTLCPLVLPYMQSPVTSVFKPDKDYSPIGGFVGHNGSSMFLDQQLHTIRYSTPKSSLAGLIEPDTVLFRGWIIWGERAEGVAYTFKKGCPPAPYHVSGEFPRSPHLILNGEAPIREGCKVVGYTAKSKNARLVFDLPLD